ncbi:hypothetical protein [Cupriavidus metallidurans]|uniref:hypothetical protein n=1 Tax=Cupriavidus metallidurans TaxID=119219 RepID=UPI001CCA9E4B|nr:hypothetical protein [Cupriavidus metallidurans]UBM12807.1 hypothetical protein LAI70_28040 [Cupriavidus metallidurans]
MKLPLLNLFSRRKRTPAIDAPLLKSTEAPVELEPLLPHEQEHVWLATMLAEDIERNPDLWIIGFNQVIERYERLLPNGAIDPEGRAMRLFVDSNSHRQTRISVPDLEIGNSASCKHWTPMCRQAQAILTPVVDRAYAERERARRLHRSVEAAGRLRTHRSKWIDLINGA